MKFMSKGIVGRASALVIAAFISISDAEAGSPRISFNDDWRFMLSADDAASGPDYNDDSWRELSLPHDWAIEGDFSEDNPSGTGGGALPGGMGWYRKRFSIGNDSLKEGKRYFLDFDGAYMNASVYVNGHHIGTRPYGYASFSYDITPYLVAGDNTVAVKVDNVEQPNSRWYSGCGIYRNVWMREKNPVHIPLWGQYVAPYDVSPEKAMVKITTRIDNTSSRQAELSVDTRIISPEGRVVASSVLPLTVGSGSSGDCLLDIEVRNPELWSPSSPSLYEVRTTVRDNGKIVDEYSTVTGFRDLRFDAQKGFFINGEHMKINGVCLHHDAGALGAVVNRAAIRRQLQIMKDMGANAIRPSHNPPAPELLELCDSMGLMVMDETFDMWRKKKTKHDYARYFNEWHERDLKDLILRDRNHPSIIMWSIGNEVLEQWSDAQADTLTLEQANLLLNFGHGKEMLAHADSAMSVNSLLTIKLADMVRELDDTRPITAGCNEPDPGNHLFRSGALDIIGYNYHDAWFKDVPNQFPGKPFVVTEGVSGLMTRGYYRMPSDSLYIWPERWDKPFFEESFSCSSYDNCHVPWGNSHEGTMRLVEDNDFIMGQFVWTGFDYLGEPTPFGWPARSSFFGIVDLAGFPKDIYYLYQSRWRPDKTVLHLFPHWNWTPGQEIDLWAYYNNADEVELFVNGVSQGKQSPDSTKYHAMWRVIFEPGEITAVSRKDGQEVARQTIRTAGEPAAIRLTADKQEILPDGDDLCFITAEIVDKDGNLCPNAENDIVFRVEGGGKNEGVDNGSPISLERFKADSRKAFNGKALLIVRSTGEDKDIKVSAKSSGLDGSDITLNIK